MSSKLSQTLRRGRLLAASFLMLAVQFMPLSAFWNNTASAAETGFKTPTLTTSPSNWDVDTLKVKPTANPSLSRACGLDIALVIDRSSSINTAEMNSMKDALNSFVDALAPTPTQFSVTRFATTATTPPQSFTDNTTAVKNYINNTTTGGGYTNWEDGLKTANGTFSGARPGVQNLILFATDGDPTTSGNGSSLDANQPNAHLAPAVSQANLIKSQNTRIVGLGIGFSNDSLNRLAQVSGPVTAGSIENRDMITTNFATLAADLAEFAQATCGGHITTTKLVDHDSDPQTPAVNGGAGWNFQIGNENYGTDADGKTVAVDVGTGTYSVKEAQKPGYQLVGASCKTQSGANRGQFNQNNGSVDGITIGNSDIVSCTFTNRPTTGKLTVKKVVNGGPSNGKPQDFSFKVNNGNPLNFENDGSNDVVISEGNYKVEEVNVPSNYTVSYSGDCEGSLAGGLSKTCTITNTYVPKPELTVVKYATNDNGGTILAKDFSLFLNGNPLNNPSSVVNTLPGVSSATYSNIVLNDGVNYSVSETIPAGYSNDYINCYNVTNDPNNPVPISNNFKAANGQRYLCNLGNNDIAPKLIVKKIVNNQYGGTLGEHDFSLFVNGNKVTSGVANEYSAGTTAVVTENDVFGYNGTFSGDCGQGTPLMMVLGGIYECIITNNDQPGKLIIKKVITNNNGSTKTFKDFSFKVNDNPAVSFNDDGINQLEVPAGKYTVTEMPSTTHKASYDNCANIEIKIGETHTCVITNDDIAPKISFQKITNTDTDTKFYFRVPGIVENLGMSNGGVYDTDNLTAGQSYDILEKETDGWKLSVVECSGTDDKNWTEIQEGNNPRGIRVTPQAGEHVKCKFYNNKRGSISGFKLHDANANASEDTGEERLPNWTIQLYEECSNQNTVKALAAIDNNNHDRCYNLISTTTTDNDGNYSFNNLDKGWYKVCEVQQAGWIRVFPTGSDCHEIYVDAGEDCIANFANMPEKPGEVLGEVTPQPAPAPKALAVTGLSITEVITAAIAIISLTFTAVFVGRRNQEINI